MVLFPFLGSATQLRRRARLQTRWKATTTAAEVRLSKRCAAVVCPPLRPARASPINGLARPRSEDQLQLLGGVADGPPVLAALSETASPVLKVWPLLSQTASWM
jgi:hypothetical protein